MRAVILALGLMTLSLALSNRNSVQGSFLPDPLNDIENFINNTVLHLKGNQGLFSIYQLVEVARPQLHTL